MQRHREALLDGVGRQRDTVADSNGVDLVQGLFQEPARFRLTPNYADRRPGAEPIRQNNAALEPGRKGLTPRRALLPRWPS